MKWPVAAIVFTATLPYCQGNAESDDGSLLQVHMQGKQRLKNSLQAGAWQRTVQVSNHTAQCSCHAVGCPLSLCAPCPDIACACACQLHVPECKCCNGDRDCIAKKIEALGRKNILAMERDEKYKQDVDRHNRQLLIDARKEEDNVWKHQKKWRKHEMGIRKDEDEDWEQVKSRHKEMDNKAKQRTKDFKEYISDLSDVVDGVLHELQGGEALVMAPFVEWGPPDCNCPRPIRCPPEPHCPMCLNRCPPCEPCYHEMDCESCDEDATIKEYVTRYMEGHSWHLVETHDLEIEPNLDWVEQPEEPDIS